MDDQPTTAMDSAPMAPQDSPPSDQKPQHSLLRTIEASTIIPVILMVIVVIGGAFLILNKNSSSPAGSSTIITSTSISSSNSSSVESSSCPCLTLQQAKAILGDSQSGSGNAQLNITYAPDQSSLSSLSLINFTQFPQNITSNITRGWQLTYNNSAGITSPDTLSEIVLESSNPEAYLNYFAESAAFIYGGNLTNGTANGFNYVYYNQVSHGYTMTTVVGYKGSVVVELIVFSTNGGVLSPSTIVNELSSVQASLPSSGQVATSSYVPTTVSSSASSSTSTTLAPQAPCHCLSLQQIQVIFNASAEYKDATNVNLNVVPETISGLRQSVGPLYPYALPSYLINNITSSWNISYTLYPGTSFPLEPASGLSVETKGSASALFNYAVNDTALEASGASQADDGGTVHGGYSNGIYYDYITFGNSKQVTIIAYKGDYYIQMTFFSDTQLQPNFIISQLSDSM